MKYNKILVTGGAGFIGSHIVDFLLENNREVSVVDNLCSGKKENLSKNFGNKNFRFIKGDIRDYELVKQSVKDVDAVFHEAALVAVAPSIKDPLTTNEVNVTGTLNLLNACLDSNVNRFIYASSCSIYGNAGKVAIKEENSKNPRSPYATSKLAAENYCRTFFQVYGLNTISLRYFNVYGSRQHYSQYSGVINVFINRILKNQPPIIHGDGKQTRDFVHVQDVVQASLLSLESEGAVGEEFNIATGRNTSINQLSEILLRLADHTHLQPKHVDARLGDLMYSCADISKAKRILGYEPRISLEDGLKTMLEYYLNQ